MQPSDQKSNSRFVTVLIIVVAIIIIAGALANLIGA